MSFFSVNRFFIRGLVAFFIIYTVELSSISEEEKSTEGIEEAPNESRLLGRIVNGSRATLNQFPHQVSLRKVLSGGHFCGGSIIDSGWILTAAHCMFLESGAQLEPWQIIVVAGEIWLNQTSPTGQRSLVNIIIIHENWSSETYENDVALLRLTRRITFENPAVQPQVLRKSSVSDRASCQIAGWGYPAATAGTLINELMYVDVPIIATTLCRKLLVKFSDIPEGMICAGYIEGLRDACQGDSGGGLICDGILTGIVSWGHGCAAPMFPGVYTDVKHYRNWVLERTGMDDRSSGTGGAKFSILPNLPTFVVMGFAMKHCVLI